MINNTPNNRVRYSFYHDTIGNVYIKEPIGFNSDDLEYARSTKYDGVFTTLSNNLEFYDDGKTIISDFYDANGINGRLELIKEELKQDATQGNNTMRWYIIYRGYSDFSTYVLKEFKAICEFTTNDLEDLIKAREGVDVEIDRVDTIDGKTTSEITQEDVTLIGRDILVLDQSILKETQVFYADENPDGSFNFLTNTPLTTKVSSQHDDFSEILSDTVGTNWTATNMFFVRSDSARTVTVDIDLEVSVSASGADPFASIFIYKIYWDGANYNVTEKINVGQIIMDGTKQSIILSQDFNLVIDDSLALAIEHQAVDVTFSKFNLTVSETSTYTEVNPLHKFVFVYPLFDKIVTILSNKEKSFKSNFFGSINDGYSSNGVGSFTGIISGLSIRNFLKGAERYKPMVISFKDLFSSLDAIWNVGMGIEKINNRDKVVVEDKKYFYQNYVVVELGEVTNLEISIDERRFYNEIECGFNKSGGYERNMGLDEPSGKLNFTSSVLKIKNKYTKTSKVRNDSYGKAFAIRKPQIDYPTEDTEYDEYNWFLDIKDTGNGYTEKLWADRFSKKPTGVFSVETLTGAYFSPINNLLRHSWWFSQGYEKDLDKYLKFSSSTGNSDLKTQISDIEYSERADILNYNLERPLLSPRIYKFNYPVDSDLLDLINGYTEISNENVPNVNCLISFKFKGRVYFGYLDRLKPNGVGDWELIESNTTPRRLLDVKDTLSGSLEIFTGTGVTSSIIDASINTPPIIGTLSYVSNTPSSISLSWTAATDDTSVTNYKVYKKLNSSPTWVLYSTESGSTLSKTVTGLSDYTEYDFSIIAVDGSALESERSNTITHFTSDGISPTIGTLTVGVPTDTEIPLTWTAATDNVGVVGYNVLYKLTSDSIWTKIDTLSTSLSYTITGLNNSSSYDIKIQAYDAVPNTSIDSNIETISTLASGAVWYSYLISSANTTSLNACSDITNLTVYMTSASPTIGDYAYTRASLSSTMIGGDSWYKISTFGSFKINNSGQITDSSTCI